MVKEGNIVCDITMIMNVYEFHIVQLLYTCMCIVCLVPISFLFTSEKLCRSPADAHSDSGKITVNQNFRMNYYM